jgi:hypothetical protein
MGRERYWAWRARVRLVVGRGESVRSASVGVGKARAAEARERRVRKVEKRTIVAMILEKLLDCTARSGLIKQWDEATEGEEDSFFYLYH